MNTLEIFQKKTFNNKYISIYLASCLNNNFFYIDDISGKKYYYIYSYNIDNGLMKAIEIKENIEKDYYMSAKFSIKIKDILHYKLSISPEKKIIEVKNNFLEKNNDN